MMKILHIVDSGGMYGKEKVVLSLLKLEDSTNSVCNVSSRTEFISNVNPEQRREWESVDFNEYNIVHCHGEIQ